MPTTHRPRFAFIQFVALQILAICNMRQWIRIQPHSISMNVISIELCICTRLLLLCYAGFWSATMQNRLDWMNYYLSTLGVFAFCRPPAAVALARMNCWQHGWNWTWTQRALEMFANVLAWHTFIFALSGLKRIFAKYRTHHRSPNPKNISNFLATADSLILSFFLPGG